MCLPISMCFQSLMCLWDQFTKLCLLMWRACRWFAVRCLRFGPLPLRQDSQIVAQIIPQSCLTPLSSYFRRLFGLVKFLYVNMSDVTNVSRVPFRFNLWASGLRPGCPTCMSPAVNCSCRPLSSCAREPSCILTNWIGFKNRTPQESSRHWG